MSKELGEFTTIAIPKELAERIKDHGKMGTKYWEVIDKLEQSYREAYSTIDEPIEKLSPIKSPSKKVPITEKSQIKTVEDTTEYYKNMREKRMTTPTIKVEQAEIPLTPKKQLEKDIALVNVIIGIEQNNADSPDLMKTAAEEKAELIKRIGEGNYTKIEKEIKDKQNEDGEYM